MLAQFKLYLCKEESLQPLTCHNVRELFTWRSQRVLLFALPSTCTDIPSTIPPGKINTKLSKRKCSECDLIENIALCPRGIWFAHTCLSVWLTLQSEALTKFRMWFLAGRSFSLRLRTLIMFCNWHMTIVYFNTLFHFWKKFLFSLQGE